MIYVYIIFYMYIYIQSYCNFLKQKSLPFPFCDSSIMDFPENSAAGGAIAPIEPCEDLSWKSLRCVCVCVTSFQYTREN